MDLRLFYFDMATSTDVTLLGVSIDNKLTFKNHTDELCRKASYKLQDLHRIRLFYQKNKPSWLKMHLLSAFICSSNVDVY